MWIEKKSMIFAGCMIVASMLCAEDMTNQEAKMLLKSKNRSDMSYKQMMQRMGEAYKMMHTGIIEENLALVRLGANLIQNHPAPKEKPWSIVKKEDIKSFKKTLLAYDKLLHQGVEEIEEEASKKPIDWSNLNQKVFSLSQHCISCHSAWKNNLR